MKITEFLSSDAVIAEMRVANKKQLLSELATAAGRGLALDGRAIFETLLQREKLGSTGLGQGIAIPHGKLAGIDRVHAVFARLGQPVDFEAVDGQPVDLVFMLLAGMLSLNIKIIGSTLPFVILSIYTIIHLRKTKA